jgi:outer membrane protein assembly factor BamB
VVGYDLATGKELWTVRGLSRAVCSTPVVGGDGRLYVAGWARGGDIDERISVEPFDKLAAARDKNGNGTLERAELEKGHAIERRFPQVDRDKTGTITRKEYEYYRNLFDVARNVVLAIRPGASGDATRTHVAWEYRRHIPFCASPLFFNNTLFTVKDGGILTSLDARSGKPLQTRRIPGAGNYYSSPVAGDGKVYLLDQKGRLSVISGEGKWTVLHRAQFGEETYATPAIVDGRIYLRTDGHLYCFE